MSSNNHSHRDLKRQQAAAPALEYQSNKEAFGLKSDNIGADQHMSVDMSKHDFCRLDQIDIKVEHQQLQHNQTPLAGPSQQVPNTFEMTTGSNYTTNAHAQKDEIDVDALLQQSEIHQILPSSSRQRVHSHEISNKDDPESTKQGASSVVRERQLNLNRKDQVQNSITQVENQATLKPYPGTALPQANTAPNNPLLSQQIVVSTREMNSNGAAIASNYNMFSNSFDEIGETGDMASNSQLVEGQLGKPHKRNCKSSTRMPKNKGMGNNGTKQRQTGGVGNQDQKSHQQHLAIPLLQNLNGLKDLAQGGFPLTAKQTSASGLIQNNRKQEGQNNFMKTKQPHPSTQYQQVMLNQLQRGVGTSLGGGQEMMDQIQNSNQLSALAAANSSFQDLSNRSHMGLSHVYGGGFTPVQQQYYGGGGSSSGGNSRKPITPHQNPMGSQNAHLFQSIILNAGSAGKGAIHQSNSSQMQMMNMDPQTYFRWKQQKYKSSRSNAAGGHNGYGMSQVGMNPNQFMLRQNSNNSIMNNSQQIVMHNSNHPYPQFHHTSTSNPHRNKGNQTQKNKKSSAYSSSGGNASVSMINTSSTGLTMMMGGQFNGQQIKSLSEVSNPQYFMSLKYNDRKLTDLKGISQFKNLSELDISGNMLTDEIPELRQLQFLKKLNLSNNQITNIYPLSSNLEILNLSYNKLKSIRGEVAITLKNLTTLDVTQNGLESLEGLNNMKRLKRLLSKNNQIQELSPLYDIETLIEIDLENNPVDNYTKVLMMLANKKDILVVNLKLSPVFLTISSYEQLCHEFETSLALERQNCEVGLSSEFEKPPSSSLIDQFKKRLKHYQQGSLYRSKRAFNRLRIMQQHSKRSSSNFSNGSSSCGGGKMNHPGGSGLHTAGRGNNGAAMYASSGGNAFSPLLQTTSNIVSTPHQQQQPFLNQHQNHHATQRLEDVEQIYDEILDEEEEHERKFLKFQQRKLKRMGDPNSHQSDDSGDEDYDESISLYEEEDYLEGIHPNLSYDGEDIDDLQSYRNQHLGTASHEGGPLNNNNDFLNESTADFNKEIKQINQELREQFGNDIMGGMPSTGAGQQVTNSEIPTNNDHMQSFQSTQSLLNNINNAGTAANVNNSANQNQIKTSNESSKQNTQKKNLISFKLDLSKCTNQQSEEDEDECSSSNFISASGINLISGAAEDDGSQFEIPGLQFLKVTDDSFRQFSRQAVHGTKHSAADTFKPKTKGQEQEQSSRNKNVIRDQESVKEVSASTILQTSVQSVASKQPQKQIIIPKLQLGALQQQHHIPLKSNILTSGGQKQSGKTALASAQIVSQQSAQQQNSLRTLNPITTHPAQPPSKEHQDNPCQKCENLFKILKEKYEKEMEDASKEISMLKDIISEIKEIFGTGSADLVIKTLPDQLKALRSQTIEQMEALQKELEVLRKQCLELTTWKEEKLASQDRQKARNYENENTINDLQAQIRVLMHNTQRDLKPSILTQKDGPCGGTLKQLHHHLEYNNFFTELEDCPSSEILLLPQPNDFKRAMSTKLEQKPQTATNCPAGNPNYFYNSSSRVSGTVIPEDVSSLTLTAEDEVVSCNTQQKQKVISPMASSAQIYHPQTTTEPAQKQQLMIQTTRKRHGGGNHQQQQSSELMKIKRPQSAVAGLNQRRSSQGIGAKGVSGQQNSTSSFKILKIDTASGTASSANGALISKSNIRNRDEACGANEYCSNQELMMPLDLTNIHNSTTVMVAGQKTTPLSRTLNRKVGHYLQRLKERNSSLQDRLNGSFRDNSESHSAVNLLQSPTPQGVGMLNFQSVNYHNQNQYQLQESISNNPYILSPTGATSGSVGINNHKYTDSTASQNKPIPQLVLQQSYQSAITAPPVQSTSSALNQSLNLGGATSGYNNAGLLKQISYKEPSQCNSTRRQAPHVNRFNACEYSTTQQNYQQQQQQQQKQQTLLKKDGQQVEQQNCTASKKQHSKTQRIHVNKVQYNQLFGGGSSGAPRAAVHQACSNNSSALGSKGADVAQFQANLVMLLSGRGELARKLSEDEDTAAGASVVRQTGGGTKKDYQTLPSKGQKSD